MDKYLQSALPVICYPKTGFIEQFHFGIKCIKTVKRWSSVFSCCLDNSIRMAIKRQLKEVSRSAQTGKIQLFFKCLLKWRGMNQYQVWGCFYAPLLSAVHNDFCNYSEHNVKWTGACQWKKCFLLCCIVGCCDPQDSIAYLLFCNYFMAAKKYVLVWMCVVWIKFEINEIWPTMSVVSLHRHW